MNPPYQITVEVKNLRKTNQRGNDVAANVKFVVVAIIDGREEILVKDELFGKIAERNNEAGYIRTYPLVGVDGLRMSHCELRILSTDAPMLKLFCSINGASIPVVSFKPVERKPKQWGEKITIAAIIAVLAITAASLVGSYKVKKECDARGGVVVRGTWEHVCIDAGTVKK